MSGQTREKASPWGAGAVDPNRPAGGIRPAGGQTYEPSVQALENERARLEKELQEIRREQQLLAERHAAAVEQSTMLTTLFVACQRLHSCADRKEVLLTVREIIANLVGCEEYLLYRMQSDGVLCLEDSYGLDVTGREMVLPHCGQIGRSVQTGQPYWAEEEEVPCSPRGEAGLTACIPLKCNGVVTGALILFRLLPQKSGLHRLDHELFRVLETHVATTLICTDWAKTQRLASGGAA
jgi:GAF domain-containing protein